MCVSFLWKIKLRRDLDGTKASKGTPKNIIALNSSNFEQKNAILFLCDV